MAFVNERRSLLSSSARVQVPWIKVTIGKYTFGVYSRSDTVTKDEKGIFRSAYNVTYPNYVQRLEITKINGQVNQYTLSLSYPVTMNDDPNFFEKVFSSVSNTRKIVFSYGDMNMPTYIYKEEEALITKVSSNFNLQGGIINYTVNAVSSAALSNAGSYTFMGGMKKPSLEIRNIFLNEKYGLKDLFKGMAGLGPEKLSYFIAGDDKVVRVDTKYNTSALDYIAYLVSCMVPASFIAGQNADTDIYVLTMHDDTAFDERPVIKKGLTEEEIVGAYFKVERVSYKTNKSDAYQIDIGFGNTGTIVTAFNITDDQSYSLLYNYNDTLETDQYVQRIDNNGKIYDVWSPAVTSKNKNFLTRAEDITWWTKITQFPIKGSITIQGLLRPAILMTYLRLNVIFPGGNKHIASGLYLITSQKDIIDSNGYKTTLGITKISGDNPLADD